MRPIDADSINPDIYKIPPRRFAIFQEIAKQLPTIESCKKCPNYGEKNDRRQKWGK